LELRSSLSVITSHRKCVWRYHLGKIFSERRLRYRIRRANITPECVSIDLANADSDIASGKGYERLMKMRRIVPTADSDIASGKSFKTFFTRNSADS
jgi:hypothetical protein